MIESFYERMYRINSNRVYATHNKTSQKIHETFGAILKSYKKSYPTILEDAQVKKIVNSYYEICSQMSKDKNKGQEIYKKKKLLKDLAKYLEKHYNWCFPEFYS